MKINKKWITLALLLVTALVLVGCAPKPAPKATTAPTAVVTAQPTAVVTEAPTAAPTAAPTEAPTAVPTVLPTDAPTAEAQAEPTQFTVETIAETAAAAVAAVIPTQEPKPMLLLTLKELAEFNGKDGKPAYVAVDGVIYDMTNSLPWKDGKHNGFTAGNDLTKEIKEISPHGVKNLLRVPAIGKLIIELTPDELAQFNGKDGKQAYVAVSGIVYDVTNSPAWKDGAHKGLEAGKDVTLAVTGVMPHVDLSQLPNVIVVGRLVP